MLHKKIFKLNLFATIRLNFRYFSFVNAIKFPIIVWGKYRIINTSGSLVVNCKIKTGLISLNQDESVCLSNGNHYIGCFNNSGKIIINGKTNIQSGTAINTGKYGMLEFGEHVYIGPNSIIYAHEKIRLGSYVRSSWNVQYFDTDFHYVIMDNNFVYKKSKPISIGDRIWIGNSCSIMKGSIIVDDSIVSSHSLVNKDLQETGSGLYAGVPAKLKKENSIRLFDDSIELKLDEIFTNNPDIRQIRLTDIN